PAGVGERVDQLAPITEQEARRHDPFEEGIISAHQLGEGMAATDGGKRRGRRPAVARSNRRRPHFHRYPRVAPFLVDAPALVDGLVSAGEGTRRFTGAQEQCAVPVEGEVEEREDLLLGGGLKVDEHVSAADEIDPREWRVLDDVVLREHHHLPQLRYDLVAVPVLYEVAGEAIG